LTAHNEAYVAPRAAIGKDAMPWVLKPAR